MHAPDMARLLFPFAFAVPARRTRGGSSAYRARQWVRSDGSDDDLASNAQDQRARTSRSIMEQKRPNAAATVDSMCDAAATHELAATSITLASSLLAGDSSEDDSTAHRVRVRAAPARNGRSTSATERLEGAVGTDPPRRTRGITIRSADECKTLPSGLKPIDRSEAMSTPNPARLREERMHNVSIQVSKMLRCGEFDKVVSCAKQNVFLNLLRVKTGKCRQHKAAIYT